VEVIIKSHLVPVLVVSHVRCRKCCDRAGTAAGTAARQAGSMAQHICPRGVVTARARMGERVCVHVGESQARVNTKASLTH